MKKYCFFIPILYLFLAIQPSSAWVLQDDFSDLDCSSNPTWLFNGGSHWSCGSGYMSSTASGNDHEAYVDEYHNDMKFFRYSFKFKSTYDGAVDIMCQFSNITTGQCPTGAYVEKFSSVYHDVRIAWKPGYAEFYHGLAVNTWYTQELSYQGGYITSYIYAKSDPDTIISNSSVSWTPPTENKLTLYWDGYNSQFDGIDDLYASNSIPYWAKSAPPPTNTINFYPDFSEYNGSTMQVNSSASVGSYVNITAMYNSHAIYEEFMTQYTHDVVDEIEDISGMLVYEDFFGIHYNDWMGSFTNITFTAYLYASNGTLLDSDSFIFDPDGEMNVPDIEELENITVPDITPYPYPTYSQGDANNSINGTNFSEAGEMIRNQSAIIQNATGTAWGLSDNIIGQMRAHILNTTGMLQSTNFTTENSILSLCPCLLTSIHYKVKAVMIYGLLLTTILIIMGKR